MKTQNFIKPITTAFVIAVAFAFSSFKVEEPKRTSINIDDFIQLGDTTKISAAFLNQLDKDEAIKCTREELLSKEFITINNKNYPELLRITFQDLERGSREIIFQKKMVSNDEVKFTMPMDLIKETEMAVLIVMKGENMFFKKIDLSTQE